MKEKLKALAIRASIAVPAVVSAALPAMAEDTTITQITAVATAVQALATAGITIGIGVVAYHLGTKVLKKYTAG